MSFLLVLKRNDIFAQGIPLWHFHTSPSYTTHSRKVGFIFNNPLFDDNPN
jgi:hypothetical protein